MLQKIRESFKFLDIASISVYEGEEEVLLDYLLPGTSKLAFQSGQVNKYPFFLPIYLINWGKTEVTTLQVLAVSK